MIGAQDGGQITRKIARPGRQTGITWRRTRETIFFRFFKIEIMRGAGNHVIITRHM